MRMASPYTPVRDAAEQQRRVAAHFAAAAAWWQDVYRRADVEGAVYQDRQAAALRLVDELCLPPCRVLEIGCGAGEAAVALARRGHTVHAVDPVSDMIRRTREGAGGVTARVVGSRGDVHQLAFRERAFTLVLALGVTPWLASLRAPLRELARVLAPGGHLVVSADNRWRLTHVLDPRLFPATASIRGRLRAGAERLGLRPPAPRLRTYSRREFDRLLAAAGFRTQRALTLGFGPFTFLGAPLGPASLGLRLHRRLQGWADRGTPILRAAGTQYVVLARREPDGAPDEGGSPT